MLTFSTNAAVPSIKIKNVFPFSESELRACIKFALWKVAVSGLYKNIRFRMIPPWRNKPVMLDDTCYFIPCASEEEAYFWEESLNSAECRDFLDSIIFYDAKRAVTVDILKRIDLAELTRQRKYFERAKHYLSNPYENRMEQSLFVFEERKEYATIK